MSLRLKLLLIISGIALSALSVFSYIAYDTTRNSGIAKEIQVMQKLLEDEFEFVAGALKEGKDAGELARELSQQVPNDVFLYLTNENGELLSVLSTQADQPNVNLFIGESREKGQAVVADRLYTWFSVPLENTSHFVTVVHTEDKSKGLSYLVQMGTSLLIAIFLTLWVSSWGAMFLAQLLEKLNEQKKALEHQAMHDGLTGLPNRTLLHDRLQQTLFAAERTGKSQALLFIDLDGFKEVNDNLGHHAGDLLLKSLAGILDSCVRRSDTVARLGGDEFAVVLKDADAAGAEIVSNKICEALEKPIMLDEEQCFVSGSIGIALYPEHADTPEILVKCADKAMYTAKQNKSRYEYYSCESEEESQRGQYKLINDLRAAIDQDQFVLNYQPKYDIVNKMVTGAEALIRWNHPSRGMVPPGVFIELAEKTGLIRRISYWVLEQAFNDHNTMQRQGYDITLSINLSVHNLQDPQFLTEVKKLIEKTGCNPRKFILEITESAVVNQLDHIVSVLKELQYLGFQISIDDFGTGYSSFVNLKELPVDEIKIDRSFVFNSTDNHFDASIVRATVEIGKSFGICVVAEGVETEDALSLLDTLGCNVAQGFLFSKPIEIEEFLVWLAQYSAPRLYLSAANKS